jgi:hypothetical protein
LSQRLPLKRIRVTKAIGYIESYGTFMTTEMEHDVRGNYDDFYLSFDVFKFVNKLKDVMNIFEMK